MRQRSQRKMIIYSLVGALFLTTVAFAAIQTQLIINGSVTRKGSSWNIYFTNLKVSDTKGTGSSQSADIESTNFTFSANVLKPGDSVTYTLDVKNGGTIDSELSKVIIDKPNDLDEKNLEIDVYYSDKTQIKEGDLLKSGESKGIIVTLKYKESAVSIPNTDDTSSFGVILTYIQEGSANNGNATNNSTITKLYGNSIQNGTPTPETPIEIESVGDKTNNLFNQSSTKTASFSTSSNTSVRSFEEGVWYLGLTYNNYFNVSNLLDYKFSENTTMVKVNGQKLYGLAQAFKVQPGQIYSLNYDDGANGRIDFGFYDANGNFLSSKIWQKGQTITIPSNAYWMTVCLSVRTASVEVTFSNLQLVLGDTITEYEPYGYKIPIITNKGTTNVYLDQPLRKIGDSTDYIDFENKLVVRNVGMLTDLNSLNWMISSNYFQAQLGFEVNSEKRIRSLSNVLPYGNANTDKSFWIDSSGTGIRIINSDIADLNSFKDWISGLDGYVLYPLVSPQTQTIELPELGINSSYTIDTTVQPSDIEYSSN